MGSIVSSVAQPVPGGSTGSGEGLFGRLIQQVINSGFIQPANQQTTQPTGITSIPVTNQNPTVNMTGGRFNPVRDPRLNRITSRPMFRTSRYDGQINQLLGKLIPDSTPQMRPTTDPMGRSYSDPRYYKMGGRVNYQNGGPTKTPPKYIPLNMESVAKEIFGTTNLDNLTYNEKQTIYDYIEANRNKKANGGRIGYADGTPAAGLAIKLNRPVQPGDPVGSFYDSGPALIAQSLPRPGQLPLQQESIKEAIMSLPQTRSNPQMNAMRRYSQIRDPRMMRLMQMLKRQPAAMGGIMNLKMGGMPVEMDLRAKGGFVPIGKKERADDVPARLSKNEFVFTANAVRNAGNGDIREGAKRMYNLMHKLEAKK